METETTKMYFCAIGLPGIMLVVNIWWRKGGRCTQWNWGKRNLPADAEYDNVHSRMLAKLVK